MDVISQNDLLIYKFLEWFLADEFNCTIDNFRNIIIYERPMEVIGINNDVNVIHTMSTYDVMCGMTLYDPS